MRILFDGMVHVIDYLVVEQDPNNNYMLTTVAGGTDLYFMFEDENKAKSKDENKKILKKLLKLGYLDCDLEGLKLLA